MNLWNILVSFLTKKTYKYVIDRQANVNYNDMK